MKFCIVHRKLYSPTVDVNTVFKDTMRMIRPICISHSGNPIVWETSDTLMRKCGEQFQEARIFDGKTFWEAEPEMEWVDEL